MKEIAAFFLSACPFDVLRHLACVGHQRFASGLWRTSSLLCLCLAEGHSDSCLGLKRKGALQILLRCIEWDWRDPQKLDWTAGSPGPLFLALQKCRSWALPLEWLFGNPRNLLFRRRLRLQASAFPLVDRVPEVHSAGGHSGGGVGWRSALWPPYWTFQYYCELCRHTPQVKWFLEEELKWGTYDFSSFIYC